MSQHNSRRVAASLALVGLFSLLPFSELQAAPRKSAPRGGMDVWQGLEHQVSTLRGELARVWNKVGARIDDNGFFQRVANGSPTAPEPAAPTEKPSTSGQ